MKCYIKNKTSKKSNITKYFYHIKQPLNIALSHFSNQQFYIYEIDDNLRVLQKIKIPKPIFKNFIKNFSRWEFECFMAFRLNDDDLEFFKSQINFYRISPYSCIDVFISCHHSYICFDKDKIFMRKILYKEKKVIGKLCKNIVKFEYFPECRTQKQELKLISNIIQKDGFGKVYFIENRLKIYFHIDEIRKHIFEIDDFIYPKLLNEFNFFYKPTKIDLDNIQTFLPDKIKVYCTKFLSKYDYTKIELGYNADPTSPNFKLILQYDNYFEVFNPTSSQKNELEKYFYKPTPNDNLLLGILELSDNKLIIPYPRLYCFVYKNRNSSSSYVDDDELIDFFFFQDDFDINHLVKILGMKKTKKLMTYSYRRISLNKKQLLSILKIINIPPIENAYYELGVNYCSF